MGPADMISVKTRKMANVWSSLISTGLNDCIESVIVTLNSSQNGYWKNCHGVCIDPREKCDESCGPDQCEDAEAGCRDPELDRTEREKRLGLYPVKTCEGQCLGAGHLCDASCGLSSQYCWHPHTRKCLSVKEKSEKVLSSSRLSSNSYSSLKTQR